MLKKNTGTLFLERTHDRARFGRTAPSRIFRTGNLLQFKLRNDGPEWLSDFTKAAQPIGGELGVTPNFHSPIRSPSTEHILHLTLTNPPRVLFISEDTSLNSP